MSTIATARPAIQRPEPDYLVDDAQLAAAAFLARYSGRTLDAYRHDLRGFFQWAADNQLAVLAATRPHIELFRTWMEERGLAPSTIDRRLSTVCGFYRFAHIDGRIGSNPAQYVRRPQVRPRMPAVWTAPNSACSCSPPTSTTATTRPSRCCSGSTGCG
jgi:site-specific recombinase XerD